MRKRQQKQLSVSEFVYTRLKKREVGTQTSRIQSGILLTVKAHRYQHWIASTACQPFMLKGFTLKTRLKSSRQNFSQRVFTRICSINTFELNAIHSHYPQVINVGSLRTMNINPRYQQINASTLFHPKDQHVKAIKDCYSHIYIADPPSNMWFYSSESIAAYAICVV